MLLSRSALTQVIGAHLSRDISMTWYRTVIQPLCGPPRKGLPRDSSARGRRVPAGAALPLSPWGSPSTPARGDNGSASETDRAADRALLLTARVAAGPQRSMASPLIGGAGGAGCSSRSAVRPAHHDGDWSAWCRGRVSRAGRRDRGPAPPREPALGGAGWAGRRCGGGA